MILNKAQAEAVYSAMRALNNVGGRLEEVRLDDANHALQVTERQKGAVQVIRDFRTAEHYDSQAAFATAYGL